MCDFFCECYGDHRDLHVLTHSFPTRRSSDLKVGMVTIRLYRPFPSAELVAALPAPCRSIAVLDRTRSEEHTSVLQSLMRNSYAVFCLKKIRIHRLIKMTSGISVEPYISKRFLPLHFIIRRMFLPHQLH